MKTLRPLLLHCLFPLRARQTYTNRFCLLLLLMAGTSSLSAAVRTWDGSSDGYWSTAANWSGNVAPVNGDDLVFSFPTAARVTTNDIASLRLNTITFSGGDRSTLRGNSITLTNGISAPSSTFANYTIDLPITCGASQTFSCAFDARVLLNGSLNLGTFTLTLDVNGIVSPQFEITGAISGAGGLVKTGNGSLRLSGANSFSGAVIISDGGLEAYSDTALGSTVGGTIFNGRGDLILHDAAIGNEALTVNGSAGGDLYGYNSSWAGPITLNTNLGVRNGLSMTTLSGVISGTGGLYLYAGTLRLSGSSGNTYTGTTRVQGGTLELQKSIGNAIVGPLVIGDLFGGPSQKVVRLLTSTVLGNIPVTIYADGLLDLNGYSDSIGSLTLNGGDVTTGTGTLTLGGDVSVFYDSTISGKLDLGIGQRTFTVAGTLGNADLRISAAVSNGGMVKEGAGRLILSGVNTYAGTTTINDGILVADNNSALGAVAGRTTVNHGGTLWLGANADSVPEPLTLNGTGYGGTNGALLAVLAVAETGNITLATPSTILADGQLTLSGVISGVGPLTKAGGGSLFLSGFSDNTYLGDTIVADGTLYLSKIGAASIPSHLVIGDGTPFGPATAARHTSSHTIIGGITVNRGGLYDLNGQSESFSLAQLGGQPPLRLNDGGDVQTGAGQLFLPAGTAVVVEPGVNGSSSISGRLALEASLAFGGNHTFAVNNTAGIGAAPLTISAALEAVSSTAHVIKTGPGEMRLTGNNTYTGQLAVNGGRVTLASSTALGASSGGVLVSSNAVLAIDGSFTFNEPLTLNSTAASSLVILSADSVWNGTIALSKRSAITVSPGISLLVLGAITGGNMLTKIGLGDLILGGNSSNTERHTRVHEGTLVLSSSFTSGAVTGGLTIGDGVGGANADVVRLNRLRQIDNGVLVTLASSGLLDLNGFSESFGSLEGSGHVTSGAAATLEVGLDDTSTTYDGIVSGGVSFWKRGLGTMTLSGDNTYTGPTTIGGGGKLLVNGAQAQSAVVISNGCTLGGSGVVGNITVVAGGTVSPGSSAGRLTSIGVTFSSGSTFRVELNGTTAGSGYDQLTVQSGTVQLGGATLNATLGFQSASNNTFTIINKTSAGAVGGTFNGLPENATLNISGIPFRITYAGGTGNDVVLTQLQTPPTLNFLWVPGTNLTLSWATNLGFALEANTNLHTGGWVPVTAPPVVGTNYVLTETTSEPQKFYRLRSP